MLDFPWAPPSIPHSVGSSWMWTGCVPLLTVLVVEAPMCLRPKDPYVSWILNLKAHIKYVIICVVLLHLFLVFSVAAVHIQEQCADIPQTEWSAAFPSPNYSQGSHYPIRGHILPSFNSSSDSQNAMVNMRRQPPWGGGLSECAVGTHRQLEKSASLRFWYIFLGGYPHSPASYSVTHTVHKRVGYPTWR